MYRLAILLTALLVTACNNDQVKKIDPVIEPLTIAYSKRPVPAARDMNAFMDIRRVWPSSPGGDLYIRDLRDIANKEKNITRNITNGLGDVKDIDTSADGDRIIFSMCEIAPCNPIKKPSAPTWDIWEYTLSTDTLRRIIAADITANAGNDTSPHYLPDGRIVFLSTRQKQTRARLLDEGKPQFLSLDENRREQASVLHIMNEDGSNIRQISFNQSHDLSPFVLKNGRILFSRWDNMGGRNQISLYTIRPDGTELTLVYGAHSHNDTTNIQSPQFMYAKELDDGRIMALILPFTGTQKGGELVIIDTENFTDANSLRPTSTFSPPISTQTSATSLLISSRTPSKDGRFINFVPLNDGSQRVLVSWSPCRQLNNTAIIPCQPTLTGQQPSIVEAAPLYSLYLYDFNKNTLLPVMLPEEGMIIGDIAIATSKVLPDALPDKGTATGLDQSLINNQTGAINIRSVYDFDGTLNVLGATASSISGMADPAQTTANERPARFLRIIKATALPDKNTLKFNNTAFGRSRQQSMREIIGYAPIEPDGSVITQVPANIPFAVSIVDQDGMRIGSRHQNWLQLKPGETLKCHGCHNHTNPSAHGTATPEKALNDGATTTGLPFPNTDPALLANLGESMAEVRARNSVPFPLLSSDLIYQDTWTDPVSAGRPKDPDLILQYADLGTAAPVTASCQTNWDSQCRTIINYPTHIQPLWDTNRGANTCTACHTTQDATGAVKLPDAQLDLSGTASADEPDHFISYRELFFPDAEQIINMGTLQDKLVQATDNNGAPLFETDTQGNLILDATGNPIPIMVTVNIAPVMSTAGARNSPAFFDLFKTGSHTGRLTPAELRLIAEWLDIGGQYYNNPFDIP